MEHTLYNSIDEMIRPETLSELEHKTFTATNLAPFQGQGWSGSGSKFLTLHTTNGQRTSNGEGPRYVIKRVSREWDWIMNTTGDRFGRTANLWQHGILDRLPPEIEHTVVACAEDGAGRAILMRDVTEDLLPDGYVYSEQDNAGIVDGMAALHAAFWEDSILRNPVLNLCPLEQAFTFTSQETARRVYTICPEIVGMVIKGRDLLPNYFGTDVVELLQGLAQNPRPLCHALSRFPHTLVHNDIRRLNVGITHGSPSRLLLLDFMRAVATVPALDLAWYLLTNPYELCLPKEVAIETYTQGLAQRLGGRFDESQWQPQLELSLLAALVQVVPFKVWFATYAEYEQHTIGEQVSLAWCSEHALEWARWLA